MEVVCSWLISVWFTRKEQWMCKTRKINMNTLKSRVTSTPVMSSLLIRHVSVVTNKECHLCHFHQVEQKQRKNQRNKAPALAQSLLWRHIHVKSESFLSRCYYITPLKSNLTHVFDATANVSPSLASNPYEATTVTSPVHHRVRRHVCGMKQYEAWPSRLQGEPSLWLGPLT